MMSQRANNTSASVEAIAIEKLATLFDFAPEIAFFVKDCDGRYVSVNSSLAERHGLESKAEAIGKRPSDICQGEFGRRPSQQDEDLLRTGTPVIEHLEMQWSRTNKPIWCLTTKLPIFGEDGRIAGIVGFSRDVRVPMQSDEIPEGFVGALKEFESDLAPHVSPSWLAEKSSLTPAQLNRLMRRVFGLTPSQFISRIRISAASRMLKETEKTIADIANSCGFYDHSAFARAFRNATGVTPSQFRLQ